MRRTDLQAALTRTLARARRRGRGRTGRAHHARTGAACTAGGRTARYLIAADGLHSPIRRQLGLDTRPARRHAPVRTAAALRDRAVDRSGRGALGARTSEAYVTPVGPRLVGVARAGIGPGARSPSSCARSPSYGRGCRPTTATAVRGAGPLRQRARARQAGRVLLVGDAAGYVDALTGEGIAVGLACARAAVECIAAGRPEQYEQRWRTASRRYRVITESLLWTRRQRPLARLITPAAARLPSVFETLGRSARAVMLHGEIKHACCKQYCSTVVAVKTKRAASELVTGLERAVHSLNRRVYGPSLRAFYSHEKIDRADKGSFIVLATLNDRGQLRPSELAGLVALDLSTVSRHVSYFEQLEMVAREPDPDDRRASRITITDKGRAALTAVRAARSDVLDAIFATWPAADRAEFTRLLDRLQEDLNQ